jgi:hypothetical protein
MRVRPGLPRIPLTDAATLAINAAMDKFSEVKLQPVEAIDAMIAG